MHTYTITSATYVTTYVNIVIFQKWLTDLTKQMFSKARHTCMSWCLSVNSQGLTPSHHFCVMCACQCMSAHICDMVCFYSFSHFSFILLCPQGHKKERETKVGRQSVSREAPIVSESHYQQPLAHQRQGTQVCFVCTRKSVCVYMQYRVEVYNMENNKKLAREGTVAHNLRKEKIQIRTAFQATHCEPTQ